MSAHEPLPAMIKTERKNASGEEIITRHMDVWTGAITKKSSSGRGNNKKVELTGINKLRELILELAVRGKLVEQARGDGLAQDLVSKLCCAKEILISEGRLKKSRKLPDITEEESSIPLPEGWVLARLGDVYDVRDGTHDTPKYQSSGYPLITSKNLSSGELTFDDIKFISETDHQKIQERSNVSEGDLLFAMIGSIGNPVIVNTEREFSIKNVALFKYYSSELSSPRFLKLLLENAAAELKQQAAGGVQSFVSLGKLRSWLVPLPPLAEQHRIVQKVDKLMDLCDLLEQKTSDQLEAHETLVDTLLGTLTQSENATELADNWARLAEHFDTLFATEQSIDKLKQTILQLAVMGRLVEQDAQDTPPRAMLQKITEERLKLAEAGKLRLSSRRTTPIIQESKPFPIPKSWLWTHLEDLFGVVTDGDHQAPPKSEHGVPFLVIGNLNTGEINFTDCKHVREDYYDNLDWIKKPTTGDLLYTVTGSYGIPVKVVMNKPFCVQRHVAILKATNSTPRDYVELLLASKYGQFYAESIATGIAQKTVPLVGLRKMPAPLPPFQEQHRIVQKVDELMALCDHLKERLNQTSETRCQLAETVVEGALS